MCVRVEKTVSKVFSSHCLEVRIEQKQITAMNLQVPITIITHLGYMKWHYFASITDLQAICLSSKIYYLLYFAYFYYLPPYISRY